MKLRKLLFPFSVLYNGITALRNFAYDRGWKESKEYTLPVICVGNLSVGGTGKSPMIEYLIALLQNDYQLAVLSRGYKRKTHGFLEINSSHTAEEAGDEPLQFKQKFPEVTVAVCANRQEGISKLQDRAEVILLDDAFQHRKVKPSYTILLTPFDDLYLDDLLLPAGNLRESKRQAKRADMIVVTKCPSNVSYAKLQEIRFRMPLLVKQSLYFSKISYDTNIYSKTETLPLEYLKEKQFTLVTGIAKPGPLVDFLRKEGMHFEHEKFGDHHHFTAAEISALKEKEIVLTTEKDYMRLQSNLDKFALYYLPIKTTFLNEQASFFEERIKEGIERSRIR